MYTAPAARREEFKRARDAEDNQELIRLKRPREDERTGMEDTRLYQLHPWSRAARKQVKEIGMLKKLLTVTSRDKVWKPDVQAHHEPEFHAELEKAWDDITGAELDYGEVVKARRQEIDYVHKKNVWKKITRAEATRRGWKIIKTKWIDINKGDAEHPLIRSRFVGKEFNNGEVGGLFAGTPPLEALRLLLSRAASRGKKSGRKVVMLNDVSRAFFEAPMQAGRNLCIELPIEDMTEEDKRRDMVGHLVQSLNGTRVAAANFQKEVTKTMKKIGFKVGKYNPCTYYHAGRDLICLVHGDDFVTCGSKSNCEWLKSCLQNRFEIKTKIVGSGEGEVREDRILNRVI